MVPNALAAARSLFAALNHRDVSAVLSLLAGDVVYENLGASALLRGRAEVGRFYLESLRVLPADAVFVLEAADEPQHEQQWQAHGPAVPILQAGVAWHLEINGEPVPLSRGVGVYWADPRTGLLARIWDNPEHTVKLADPALTSAVWASPLLMGLGPLVMPAARNVSSLLSTLTPGSSGDPAVGGLAAPGSGTTGAGNGLPGGLLSALTSMMPFQEALPLALPGADRAAASDGGGSAASATAVAAGPSRLQYTTNGPAAAAAAAAAAASSCASVGDDLGDNGISYRGGAAAAVAFVSSSSSSAISPLRPGPTAAAAAALPGVPAAVPSGVPAAGSWDSVNSFAGDEGDVDYSSYPILPFRSSASNDVNLTGLWEKDTAASQVQEYEQLLDVLQLGGLQKVTARLIDGVDILHDSGRFEVGFVTVVPFFKVTERSRFGAPTTMMRRDLRSGQQTSQATRVPGGVQVDMSWNPPLAGSLREEYVASQDGSLMAVTSTLRIGQRTATAVQMYRRSARDKNAFLASQRSSYGSLQDVLRSQEKKFGKTDI